MDKQRGGLLIAAALLIVVIATTVAATLLMDLTETKFKRSAESQLTQLESIKHAIASYVSIHKRLPCPADGTFNVATGLERGIELRDGSGDCRYAPIPAIDQQQTGILPWRTLGIKEDEVLSRDLTYFSYRVFSGSMGFTRNDSADMTHCDITNAPLVDEPLPASGLCNATHGNSVAQFLQGVISPPKGLTVVGDAPLTFADVAYVILHHGMNGAGAFTPSGTRNPLPAVGSVKEFGNTLGTDAATYKATYYITTPNTAVDPSDVNYFDDRVAYVRIEELAKRAGLAAREWPEDLFNANTTTGMTTPHDPLNPHFLSSGGAGTSFSATTISGVTTVAFGGVGSTYSGCLWWPNPVSFLASGGVTRYRWVFTMDFALQDYLDDEAPGLVFGFLSQSVAPPVNATCGGNFTGQLGWSDGSLAAYNGKRFGVEIDTRQNNGFPYDAGDPAQVHLAIDRSNTIHGGDAASCATSGYGEKCNLGPSTTFLSNDGLAKFHKLRIEVQKGCTLAKQGSGTQGTTTISVTNSDDISTGMRAIGNGIGIGALVTSVVGTTVTLSVANALNIPAGTAIAFQSDTRMELKAWTLSHDGCAANAPLCESMLNLGSAFSQDMSGNPEAMHVKQCLPEPSPSNAFDQMYFGITTSNRDTGTTGNVNLNLRNLSSVRHVLN